MTGDQVSALATNTTTSSEGLDEELLVGSDDYEIKIFQAQDVIREITETAKVTTLCANLSSNTRSFGYALDNGTVGVYRDNHHRLWRVKSKHKPTSLASYDLDGNGEPDLLIGWDSGKFEARRLETGEVIYRDVLASGIATVNLADYRGNDTETALCVASDGEIRGYVGGTYSTSGSSSSSMALMPESENSEERAVMRLTKEKSTLQMELRALEKRHKSSQHVLNNNHVTSIKRDNTKSSSSSSSSSSTASSSSSMTTITCALLPSVEDRACVLTLETNNEAVIKSVVVFDFDGGCFNHESFVVQQQTPRRDSGMNTSSSSSSRSLMPDFRIPVRMKKFQDTTLELKLLVGPRGSTSCYSVCEMNIHLPKFAMFEFRPNGQRGQDAELDFVKFAKPDNVAQVEAWIRHGFVLPREFEPYSTDEFIYEFTSVETAEPLVLEVQSNVVRRVEPSFHRPFWIFRYDSDMIQI